ncbi:MAG: hypothetical protein HXY34_04030 [Candidatus Thorarchaeota archaeon]|nr:hypothetical protein [Candidatus Thorarchaeota archaeon]
MDVIDSFAFTDPMFLLFAILVWSGSVALAFAFGRLQIWRRPPIPPDFKAEVMTEQAIALVSAVGTIPWFIVGPVLLGPGEIAVTLEGWVGLLVGAFLAMFGPGLALLSKYGREPSAGKT